MHAHPNATVLFTSGRTESNNLIIQQPQWEFIVTLRTEHHAILYPTEYVAAHLVRIVSAS